MPRGRAEWLAAAAVAFAAALTFARAVPSGLLASWDDDRFIIDNPHTQRISVEGLVSFFTESHMQAWHPLHMLSYWLDVPWVGPNGPVIHAVSLVLWALTLVLVLRVMQGLGLPLWIAALATLAFGLHPTQIEAVTWASGRKDILACGFASLSIMCHLRSAGRLDRANWLSLLFYALAAMSKTTALPLPGVLFLIDLLHRQTTWRRALLAQAPAFLVGAGLSIIVLVIWSDNDMIRPDAAGNTIGGRFMLVCASITHHLQMAVFPVGNAPVYAVHREADIGAWALMGPLALGSLLALSWKRHASRPALALLGFLVLLLPVMNLVPMYWHWMDRYLSLPLLPLAFGFGAGVHWASRQRPRAAYATAALVVCLLAARTVYHQQVYTSDLALWQHATQAQPESFHGWLKLGEVLRDAGRLDESIGAYEHAVQIEPSLSLGQRALFAATALRDERRANITPSRALDELLRSYIAAENDPLRSRDLASSMLEAGYRDAALMVLGRALDLEPLADERLMRAAAVQRQRGNGFLAEFYEGRVSRPRAPAP